MSNLLMAALQYLKEGYSVIPCKPEDKVAAVEWKPYQDRLPTVEEVRDWWTTWPTANIAIVTGKLSGVTVIDVDGKEGAQSFFEHLQGGIPQTRIHSTPKGKHLIFKYHPDYHTGAAFFPGIDVRNDGGYIVAPPSQINGSVYSLFRDRPIVALPFAPEEFKHRQKSAAVTLGPGAPGWVSLALQGVGLSERNMTATRLSGYLHSKGHAPDVIENLMLPFAEKCAPPMDLGELRRTIQSVVRYQGAVVTERIQDAPQRRTEGDTFVYWWEGKGIEIRLEDLHRDRTGLQSHVEVKSSLPTGPEHLHGPVNWGLHSTSGHQGLAKQLGQMMPDMDWSGMLSQVARIAIHTYQIGEPEVYLHKVKSVGSQYSLYPLILQDQPTVLAGDGGTGKSYIALGAAISVVTGVQALGMEPRTGHRVLYLDWESTADTHAHRLRQLCAGHQIIDAELPEILYRRCYGPIWDQIGYIKRLIAREAIDMVIVDSVGAASGGRLNESETGLGYFDSIRQLGSITSLSIAHVSKEAKDGKPTGSIFFNNAPRSVFEVKRFDGPDEDTIEIGMYHRKANDDKLAKPLGFHLTFEGEDFAMFSQIDPRKSPNLLRTISMTAQVTEHLRFAPESSALEIANELAMLVKDVSTCLRNGQKRGIFVNSQFRHQEGKWSLKSTREDEAPDDAGVL